MVRAYKYDGLIVEIGQIVTHDLYDGCLLKALVGEVFENHRFSYQEDDNWQYTTITLRTDFDRQVVTQIMKDLDEAGVYYETDFELPIVED